MKRRLKSSFNGAIVKARSDDLDAIMVIEDACFGDEKWSREDLGEYLEMSKDNADVPMLVAVATASADVAGYVLGEVVEGGHQAELISLAVKDSYRGQGLGRELLDRVSDMLSGRGVDKITLQVRADNAAAIHLYETSGFVKTTLLPGYYEDAGDGLEMVRTLKAESPKKTNKPSAP